MKVTSYRNIAFLFEEITEQVYVVNLPLLRAQSERLRTQNRTTTLKDAGMLWLQVDSNKPCIVSLAIDHDFVNFAHATTLVLRNGTNPHYATRRTDHQKMGDSTRWSLREHSRRRFERVPHHDHPAQGPSRVIRLVIGVSRRLYLFRRSSTANGVKQSIGFPSGSMERAKDESRWGAVGARQGKDIRQQGTRR